MRIYLKDIDINKIIACSDYSKELTIKAYNRLKKLNIDNKTFTEYIGNEKIGWISNSEDIKEELKNYNESDNKEDFMIRWYFRAFINNECSKMLYLGEVI